MAAKFLFMIASCYGLVAVGLGAFGAHGLRSRLDDSQMIAWETAVHYQAVHAVVLLALGLWLHGLQGRMLSVEWAGWLFAGGVLLFSGSIYLLVLTGARWAGPVTPLGGLLLICGWLLLIVTAMRL